MGSPSKPESFRRFLGEEVWFGWLDLGAFPVSRQGVVTSSAFNVSAPRRLTDCTIFSSRTAPFAFTFRGLEERDIVRTLLKKFQPSPSFPLRINV